MYGLGDATLNGRELAVASYLQDHVVPLLDRPRRAPHRGHLAVPLQGRLLAARAGDDDRDRRRRHGAVGHPGQGAGRAGLPAARRRVARARDGLRPRQRRRRRGDGGGGGALRRRWATRRCARSAGIPGAGQHLRRRAAASCSTSRPRRGCRSRTSGAPSSTWTSCPTLFARLRQEFGPDVHLLHDVHHRLTPIEAARLGKELEPYHLFWMEDPVPAELQEGFRLIRQHTTTPLAVGEVFTSIYDCQQLIQEQLIDYIRTTVVHAGGITPPAQDRAPRRAVPRAHRLARRDRSVAGLHGGGAALRSQRPQLRHPGVHAPQRRDRPRLPARLHASPTAYMHPGDAPGLGVDIDEALAAQHSRTSAPTCR